MLSNFKKISSKPRGDDAICWAVEWDVAEPVINKPLSLEVLL